MSDLIISDLISVLLRELKKVFIKSENVNNNNKSIIKVKLT